MTAEIDPEVRGELLPEAVRRYAGGASLRALAKEYGVSRSTLYRWLFTEMGGEEYRGLVTDCLVARIAEADEGLEDADSLLEVTKRRDIARFARMDFERRRPALYGPKQEVKHSGVMPSLTIVLAASEGGGRVLEGTPDASALPAPVEGAGG